MLLATVWTICTACDCWCVAAGCRNSRGRRQYCQWHCIRICGSAGWFTALVIVYCVALPPGRGLVLAGLVRN
jgi:hypothetical protein